MFENLAQLPDSVLTGVVFFFGLCVGSFANVVIYRWPLEKSVVTPRSSCPNCGTALSWYENIPVLSYLVLRGKCRSCHVGISIRYPLVELLTGVLLALVFVVNGRSWTTIEYIILVAALIPASVIDLDHFLLPDVITLPGLAIGLGGAALNPERSFWESLLGALLGGGFLWSIGAIYRNVRKQEGMGGGDIKLLAWLGAVLGWQAIPFVIIVASLSGSVLGLALAPAQQRGLKTVIPFGPYLAAAALLCVLGGQGWAHTYLSWFIPL